MFNSQFDADVTQGRVTTSQGLEMLNGVRVPFADGAYSIEYKWTPTTGNHFVCRDRQGRMIKPHRCVTAEGMYRFRVEDHRVKNDCKYLRCYFTPHSEVETDPIKKVLGEHNIFLPAKATVRLADASSMTVERSQEINLNNLPTGLKFHWFVSDGVQFVHRDIDPKATMTTVDVIGASFVVSYSITRDHKKQLRLFIEKITVRQSREVNPVVFAEGLKRMAATAATGKLPDPKVGSATDAGHDVEAEPGNQTLFADAFDKAKALEPEPA